MPRQEVIFRPSVLISRRLPPLVTSAPPGDLRALKPVENVETAVRSRPLFTGFAVFYGLRDVESAPAPPARRGCVARSTPKARFNGEENA